jgi:hypothetical protein
VPSAGMVMPSPIVAITLEGILLYTKKRLFLELATSVAHPYKWSKLAITTIEGYVQVVGVRRTLCPGERGGGFKPEPWSPTTDPVVCRLACYRNGVREPLACVLYGS